MTDPLGLIGSYGVNPARQMLPASAGSAPTRPLPEGQPSFKDVLIENLKQVNSLQQDANRAIEDLQTGKRTDLEGVILATQKADTAFRMLQSVRNKVIEAYDEMKQIRV